MFTEDDFAYAIKSTRVILAPRQHIHTFGDTSFHFHLITELMDSVHEVRIRDGKLHAERPRILAPSHYRHLLLEGFGEKAREFVEWLEQQGVQPAILKYGFRFKKTDVSERLVRQPVEQVIERVQREVQHLNDPLATIIQGVDDAWEVCLLKFAADLIQQSAGGNLEDFRNRGLL